MYFLYDFESTEKNVRNYRSFVTNNGIWSLEMAVLSECKYEKLDDPKQKQNPH
jgi:hypothetical protein